MSEKPIEIQSVQTIDVSAGDVMFAVIRSKSLAREGAEAGLIQITMRRSFWGAIVISGLILLHVSLLLGLVSIANQGPGGVPDSLITGVALGQAQLLGVWLAISPWAIWKRVPTVMAILAGSAWLVVGDWSFFLVSCLSVFIPSLVFALPRVLLGWRIDFMPQLPLSLPAWNRGGTMLGILGYMLACAVFLAIAQYWGSDITSMTRDDDWLGLLSMLLLITLLNASCTVAVMCPKCRAGKAVAVGVVAALVAVALAVYQLASAPDFLAMIVYSALASLPVYAGTLYLLRRLGCRLYQQTPRITSVAVEGNSFDAIECPT